MTILHIDASLQGEGSITRLLGRAIVTALTHTTHEHTVYRDLMTDTTVANPRGDNPDSRDADQFLAADTIVIGAPMYNLGIPWRLKAWIDAIAVPRKTFRYSANGPEGLAGGRRVIVAYSSGGFHRGPQEDFVEPYLRAVFGMIGITEIDVIRAEGVNVSAALREQALAQAEKTIAEICARPFSRRTADAL